MALTTDGLAHEYVGKLATGSGPGVNSPTPTETWVDNVGNADLTLVSFDFDYPTTNGWRGNGSAGDPYRLHSEGGGVTSGSYLTLAGGNLQDSAFSLEMWLYPEDADTGYNQVVFYHRDASPDSGFWVYIGIADDFFQYSVRDSTAYYNFGRSNPAADGMRHIVVTFDSGTWKSYYGGSAGGSDQSHTYTVNTDTPITIGVVASHGGYGFHGAWATIRWYSKALSADEVAANYAAGVTAASTDSSATFMPHIMCHHFIPQQLGGH